MATRLDMLQGIKPEMTTWFYEIDEKMYKKMPRLWEKLVDEVPKDKFVGGYCKSTSAIGATEIPDTLPTGEYAEDRPQEGFTVYGTLKEKALKVQMPREMERDWWRTKNWLKEYVQKNWYQALEITKEKLVANFFNEGGYTAGAPIFSNDDAQISLTTYTSPKLCYDGFPFINLASNVRPARYQGAYASTAGTYYNGLALTGVNLANAKTMYNLMTATNNIMDNGQAFDNSSDISVLCHTSQKLDWQVVQNSTLNPDNAQNAYNPLASGFKEIIANPYLTTTTFNALVRKGGIKVYFSEPKFQFWMKNDPERYFASVVMDYAIWLQNWRFVVGNNAPTSGTIYQ